MSYRCFLRAFGFNLLLWAAWPLQGATGLAFIDNNTNLTFYGDLRLRYELDWDSVQANGVPREDRSRGRIRARAGMNYALSDDWSAGIRLRTGIHQSQQSAHLTFASTSGGNDELEFVFDRYFVQFKEGAVAAWAGRNVYPIWQQTELFWDQDVTPTGIAGTYTSALGEGKFNAMGGAFYLPDGAYGLNGQLLTLGADYAIPARIGKLKFGSSLNYFHGEDGAEYLRNRNGARDYLIGTLGLQVARDLRNIPFTVGADVYYNFEDYNAADVAPFPATDTDQQLGYVFSIQAGRMKQKHDWLLGYFYSHIETFSVNASYAQDDWIRFGSNGQTDSSDFEGHEIRAGYCLSDNINVLARLFLVKAITTVQDGNRFRIDLNWTF